MAADPFLCHLAVLILLTLGGCRSELPGCGIAVTNGRIVGGVASSPGSWPWQVSLHDFGRFRCGGSLITDQWVLTAAHCVEDHAGITVYLGRHSQAGSNPGEESRGVRQAVCHSSYDFLTFDNDICLLQLSAPLNFTASIFPVCLAAADSTFHSGTSSWITGWGEKTDGQLADILQEVAVQVVGNNQCRCSHQELTDNMMCAGVAEGGKDACQGDSGGPLVSRGNASVWIQSGIVSFGDGCGQPGVPGVYTRVSRFQTWIAGITGNSRPGFVTFTSAGEDSDQGFTTCPTPPPPGTTTGGPHTSGRVSTTPLDTAPPETTPSGITHLETTPPGATPHCSKGQVTDKDRSIFGGGEHAACLSAATVFCFPALVLSLLVLVRDA